MTEDMIRTWAPDDLWLVAQPLIPVPVKRPQGGGRRRVDDRAVLAAIVYLVQAGGNSAVSPNLRSASWIRQSVKGADTVGKDSRGYDAGKKINGRKRFIGTDTAGLLITACVLAASWQDRDGGKTALLGTYLDQPDPARLR